MTEFTLRRNQAIVINGETTIKVLNITSNEKVFLGISAPRHVTILRENAKRKKPGTKNNPDEHTPEAK